MNKDEIGYALSKQVPSMEHNVTFNTDYGSLSLEGKDANRVVNLVRSILEEKLTDIPTVSLNENIEELRRALVFFDKVKAAPRETRHSARADHWDWLEAAARKVVGR